MFSVLYACDGQIHRIGPFATQAKADVAMKKAHDSGEFSLLHQNVYLLMPNHEMIEYTEVDL